MTQLVFSICWNSDEVDVDTSEEMTLPAGVRAIREQKLPTSVSLTQTSRRRCDPELRWAFPSLLCSISQQFLLLSAVVVVRCLVFLAESICDCPLIPSKLNMNTFSKYFQNLWENDRVIGGLLHSSYALDAGPF